MIGPPTDPSEIEVAASLAAAPGAWAVSLLIGVLLVVLGRRWRPLGVLGLVVLCTAPAAGLLPTTVWGHYPTIDKAGSLHFYSEGAQFRSLDVTAPATQLIGVSMGHLWVTWIFGRVVDGFVAMNLQVLLNLALGWWLAAKLAEAAGTPRRWSLIAAFPAGMGLHLFRDVNWYTIEKSGLWALTLYLWVLARAAASGGNFLLLAPFAYFWAFYYNAYWGVLGALVGAGAFLLGSRNLRVAAAASALGGVPFVLLQLPALRNAQLPPPEAFAERASLDVVGGWPPAWNRLELWASLDWLVVAAGIIGLAEAFRRPTPENRLDRRLTLGLALPLILSLGPATPFWSAFAGLPGMWRFAKPETFFHLVVLGLVVLAGRRLGRSNLQPLPLFLFQLGLWWFWVRGHPAFPGFSAPVGLGHAS